MPLQLFILASGSRANAMLISDGSHRIMVDCGLGVRSMGQALSNAGTRPDQLSGVFLTHEHTDHVRGLASLLARTHTPVFASAGTLNAVEYMVPARCPMTAMNHAAVDAGGFTVRALTVPHDAAEPVAYHIEIGSHRITVATDLGEVPPELEQAIKASHCVVLESNHDEQMLLSGSYPDILKQRIRSATGHLSNHQTAETLQHCLHDDLRTVILAHLSDENNDPELARACSARVLAGTGTSLHVTVRSAMGPFLNLD
jgi:phosphoribosyl 1,2-cyclic phosphodiesterase